MTRRILQLFLLVTLLVIVGIAMRPLLGGVTVVLRNTGSTIVIDVRLAFSGGNKDLSELKPKHSQLFEINPAWESGIILSFADHRGKPYKYNIEIYIERNYRGKIDILIDGDGNVTWSAETDLPWPSFGGAAVVSHGNGIPSE